MTFALQELEGILNEQKSFDLILSFSILPSPTPESASATVRILEDRELVVTLTHSGYTRTDESQVYETIEGLLSAASALYRERTAEILQEKLMAVLQSQPSQAEHDEIGQQVG